MAGGQSLRMGQNKAELLLGGKTLIDRAAEALFPIANTVYAVGNLPGEVTSLPIIQDHPTEGNARGAIVGLCTALVNAKTEWIAVLACDLPFVTGELMTRMLDILREVANSQESNVDAVFAEQPDGRIQPLCGLYRRDNCLPEIKKILSGDNWRLQQLRERLNPRVIKSSEIEDIRGAEFFFFNLNTPDDHLAAVEIEERLRPVL